MPVTGIGRLSGYRHKAILVSLVYIVIGSPTSALDSFDLPDARVVPTVYETGESLREALEMARPTALGAGDFDEDGVPDLVCGYAGVTAGFLTLHRGNVDAIFPHAPEARQRMLEGRFTDEPFFPVAQVVSVPVDPSLMATGDFDNDGYQDVVITDHGRASLYLLPGDGQGGLRPHVRVALPGGVTTLVAGEINRPDGPVDLIVGIVGADGPAVLVFEGPEGALRCEPETVPLAYAPTALLLGRLEGSAWHDLAVATDGEVLVIRGRDRLLGYEHPQPRVPAPPVVEPIAGSTGAVALVWGDFVTETDRRYELALLFGDGSVRYLARSRGADGWESVARNDGIKNERPSDTERTGRAVLLPARLSGSSTEDLVILDSPEGRLHAIVDAGVETSTEFDKPPVAVLPMRLNGDAWTDLVLLQDGTAAPAVMTNAALATITVNTAADSATPGDGECSLREAILNANNDADTTGGDCAAGAGPDLISFQIGGGGTTATIAVNSALPDILWPVTIDGTTQGCATPPCIALDGSATGEDDFGLHFVDGPSTVRGLAIHSFGHTGVQLEFATSGSIFEGNHVGTDLTGTQGLGNGYHGVRFLGGDDNTIGGTVAAARNVISDSSWYGLVIEENTLNVVQGNFLGTDATGTSPIANRSYAIVVTNASGNTIGGTGAGAGNLVSGNPTPPYGGGIGISGSASHGNEVLGNLIGTDITGTIGLGNYANGVYCSSTSSNTIGGTAAGAGNVISGNDRHGVYVVDSGTTGSLIQGNFIGTDVHGTSALRNGQFGILIRRGAGEHVIGGTAAGAGNVISGNGTGVAISRTERTGSLIQGNLIGTDVTGTVALGNYSSGVGLASPGNTIGGTVAGARNVISGNRIGIGVTGYDPTSNTSSNQILGNYIGTDISGLTALPNVWLGIEVWGAWDNVIGGVSASAGNVISGNANDGIRIWGSTAHGNMVHGNLIGIAADGISAVGNGVHGVRITNEAADNEIGGVLPGSGNVISANAGSGVFVEDNAGNNNSVLRNSIFSNGGLGIALGESTVRLNDPGDRDNGPNRYQNFPVVTSVSVGATHTTVEGFLNSVSSSPFRIELFSNSVCDASGHGEGESYLGLVNVATDLDGNASFSETFPNNTTVSDRITATATDEVGSTSEFSVCGADTDGDGDTISSVDDCNDTDASAWIVPGEAVDLLLSHIGGTGGTTTLAWTAPIPLGGTLTGTVYDTIRSPDPADFFTSATCVDTNGGPNSSTTDGTDPAAGTAAYFLIRAENSCGAGPLGGDGRSARSCP